MRYVIIGTGVAGISAVEAIRSVDRSGEIVMVGDDPHGYYSRPGLAYVLTGEINDSALFPKNRDDYARLKFRFIKARVTGIDRLGKQIMLDGKSYLPYDKLLLATGARAVPLAVPGANLHGVVKLDHLDDVRSIIKQAKRGRTAVVVGGGITALELTEGLHSCGMHVHYLLRGDRYWSNVLDEHESKIVETRLQMEGVDLHYKSDLAEVVGKTKVAGVRLKNGHTIKCDIVAYAIGVAPRLDLPRSIGLDVDRGILVNEYMQTNDPNIYAAGDVAQAFDPLTGKAVLDSLWTPARQQGFSAGLNMAGKARPYVKEPPFNVTRLAGLTTTIIGTLGHGRDDDMIGIARGDSETWRQLPDAIVAQGGFEVNRVRLVISEKHLIGALVMGDQTLSIPLQKIISNRLDISPIRADLLSHEDRIAELVVDFWAQHHTIV